MKRSIHSVEIANKFNEYFTNVGPTLAGKIPPVNTSFKSFLNKTHYYESIFCIQW